MNAFTDIVFIFVFVFVILHFKLVDITSNNIIIQKFFMFIAVIIFAWFLYSLKSIRHKYPIEVKNIITNGLIVGILAYVGHTLMFDLLYMKDTNQWMIDRINNYFTANIMLSFFICMSIAIGYSIRCLFNTDTCHL